MSVPRGSAKVVIPIMLVLVAALIVGVVIYATRPAPNPSACTEEAKLCPDGSYVGRTGPDCQFAACPSPVPPRPQAALPVAAQPIESATTTKPIGSVVVPPVSDALTRVTKKPFGIYVRPGASPVSPERFQGYHTGVDFETTVAEQASDVTISAICAGPLVLKKWASGYGGVAVQSCRLGAQDVTVIYGHLRLSSISATVGQELKPGQALGVLGKGYSTETDGERKHLHLGIHQGSAIDIRGYVQNQADLGQWLDVRNYLGQ